MRRLTLVFSTVLAAAIAVSVFAVSVGAQTASTQQYETKQEEGADPSEPAPSSEGPAPPASAPDPAPGPASVRAAASRINEDPYFQVVDNADARHFSAPGWRKERGAKAGGAALGDDYASAPSRGAKAVRYKVNVPEDGAYSAYARWPVGESNATAARFVVPTASGPESDVVNQRVDAGFWVMIGAFEMERGERTIRVEDGGEGTAVIDAVMLVQDAVIAPNGDTASVADPEALAPVAGDQDPLAAPSDERSSGDVTAQRAGSTSTRADIIRVARRHLGTRYATRTCRINVTEDCSCHTRLVFRRFGYTLPDSPSGQWRYGRRVTSRLASGDLVFHDLDNSGSLENNWDDHVSIYAGNGYVIHASSYFGKVVRSEMRHLPHYHGAKRLPIR